MRQSQATGNEGADGNLRAGTAEIPPIARGCRGKRRIGQPIERVIVKMHDLRLLPQEARSAVFMQVDQVEPAQSNELGQAEMLAKVLHLAAIADLRP
nr:MULTISPECIES: hypothetical protein [unclassified Bradyrhizobium]